jgi:hypothetical protein
MIKLVKHLRETRLSKSNFVYLSLRIVFAYLMFSMYGFYMGILAIVAANYAFDLLVITVFKVTPMNTTDQNVFYD